VSDQAIRSNLERYLTMVRDRHPLVGQPATHENGFIQVPVGEFSRLHVWPDAGLQKQKSDSPIHDHTFSFRSWILCGTLKNVLMHVQESALDYGTRYEIHTVSPEGKLVPTDTHANAYSVSRQSLRMGSVYELSAGIFHETLWDDLAVSLMVKTAPGGRAARVLHPHSQVVDNEFDRAEANEGGTLWSVVDRGVTEALKNLDVW
jgi:hypothetical protein